MNMRAQSPGIGYAVAPNTTTRRADTDSSTRTDLNSSLAALQKTSKSDSITTSGDDKEKLISDITTDGIFLAKFYKGGVEIQNEGGVGIRVAPTPSQQAEQRLFANLEKYTGQKEKTTNQQKQDVIEFLKSGKAFLPDGTFNFKGLIEAYNKSKEEKTASPPEKKSAAIWDEIAKLLQELISSLFPSETEKPHYTKVDGKEVEGEGKVEGKQDVGELLAALVLLFVQLALTTINEQNKKPNPPALPMQPPTEPSVPHLDAPIAAPQPTPPVERRI